MINVVEVNDNSVVSVAKLNEALMEMNNSSEAVKDVAVTIGDGNINLIYTEVGVGEPTDVNQAVNAYRRLINDGMRTVRYPFGEDTDVVMTSLSVTNFDNMVVELVVEGDIIRYTTLVKGLTDSINTTIELNVSEEERSVIVNELRDLHFHTDGKDTVVFDRSVDDIIAEMHDIIVNAVEQIKILIGDEDILDIFDVGIIDCVLKVTAKVTTGIKSYGSSAPICPLISEIEDVVGPDKLQDIICTIIKDALNNVLVIDKTDATEDVSGVSSADNTTVMTVLDVMKEAGESNVTIHLIPNGDISRPVFVKKNNYMAIAYVGDVKDCNLLSNVGGKSLEYVSEKLNELKLEEILSVSFRDSDRTMVVNYVDSGDGYRTSVINIPNFK